VDFGPATRNLYVVALGLGVGLIPTMDGHFFDAMPPPLPDFLHNGVMLGIVTALTLNVLLNGRAGSSEAVEGSG
jgi:xanthine/uracil permease